MKAIFTGKKEIDPAILEQLEEVMLTSDVGVKTTQAILERLRDQMKKSDRSVMPDDTLKDLSEQQVRDLFAYLRSSQPLP